jgi:quercetin dioxygenase-like cupin family protein
VASHKRLTNQETRKLYSANESSSFGEAPNPDRREHYPKHSRHPNAHRKILAMKRENPTIEICPGITRRTVAHGDTMYQMLATLAADSQMPAHSHPQEQIVHILEGKMRLIVEGVPHELSTGDSFYLASNVAHGVETLSATRVLDTFSPPRTDYLAIDQKVLHGAL